MIPAIHRLVRGTLAALGATALVAFSALAAAQLQQGKDYRVLPTAQTTDAPAGKIEVLEFFGYPCPHCYALETPLEAWVKKLPADVVFKRVPALFNEQYAQAGRVFYTLEAMGKLDQLHKPFFDAIHKDNLRLMSDGAVEDWVKKHGVDPNEFRKVMKSFSVESRLRRAFQMMEAYKVDSVPTIAVAGKYVALSKGPQAYLASVDQLIDMARKEGKTAAAK